MTFHADNKILKPFFKNIYYFIMNNILQKIENKDINKKKAHSQELQKWSLKMNYHIYIYIYMARCHFLISLFLKVKFCIYTKLDNKQAIEHFIYYCPRKKHFCDNLPCPAI